MSDENNNTNTPVPGADAPASETGAPPVGGAVPTPEPAVPVIPEANEDGMVSVPKGILEQLMNDVQDIKSGRPAAQPKRVNHHTATVKVIDDKFPVMAITKTWLQDKGLPNEQLMAQVEVLKDFETGEVEKQSHNYLELMNNVISYQVKILKQEMKLDEKFLGTIRKSNPDPIKFSDDGKDFTPGQTDNVVITKTYISEVEFDAGTPLVGKKITIANDYLNI